MAKKRKTSAKQRAAAKRNIKKAQAARRGGKRKKGGKKGRKGTRRRRTATAFKKRYYSASGVGKFATDSIALANAVSPLFRAAQMAGGATFGEKLNSFKDSVIRMYTGYHRAGTVYVFDHNNLADGYAPIAASLLFKKSQGMVDRYAPIRGILPSKKQGVISWGTSVAAKAIALSPALEAVSMGMKGPLGQKWTTFNQNFDVQYTGLMKFPGGTPWTPPQVQFQPDKLIRGYAPVAGAIVMKKGIGAITKNMSLKMPRL